MLNIYTFLSCVKKLKKCVIDLSTVSSETLADECDNLCMHHTELTIFFGYLEPGFMLDPKNEARIRRCIRKFECNMIVFHLESIPFAWKNEIGVIYSESPKDGNTEALDDGSAI